MKLIPTIILILLIGIFISSIDDFISASESDHKGLKIWLLSDIQPRDVSEREDFEKAVKDTNDNIGGIDFVIAAGDLVDTTTEEAFDWYIDTKKKSYVKQWYEIAGNHDLKPDEGRLYKEKLNSRFNYSVRKNNILFLFMSDEKRSSATDISDSTFAWWKEHVVNNQDKIIITVSHAPLEGSGIPFSSFNRRKIIHSERFTEVLKDYRVDLWISGHLHIPHSIMNNKTKKRKYNGTTFLNISSIRKELAGFKDSESFIFDIECGSGLLKINSRNHTEGKYNNKPSYKLRLKHPYKC